MALLVGSSLFGDGAAAVVAVGERRAAQIAARGPDVLESRSRLYPDSLGTMGWNVGPQDSNWCCRRTCPTSSSAICRDDVTTFLADHDLTIADIGAWVSHPGGPKVMESINAALGLPDDALELSWRSLSEVGNLFVGVGVVRVARHPRQAASQWQPGADAGNGSGLLFGTGAAALALIGSCCLWPGMCC